MIDFNTEPYNDDYEENKKFYRILYRPSFAVQARELTQMQTILQNQISRHGSAIFKQGAMVIPGQSSVETITNPNKGTDYVKLQVLYNGVAVQTFVAYLQGKTIIGSSGLTAQVIVAQDAEGSDPTTLYIRYTKAATDTITKVFADGEVIHTSDGTYYFQAQASGATGKGSLATIERGVYYVNDYFCLVDTQTIVLDKYSNTPTYRIGLNVTESIVTPEDDETLLDNAQNSYNFAAPGAHRYMIDLTLSKLATTSIEDTGFIELIRVTNGVVKSIVDKTAYSGIGDELARRTYDESGDYTINGFGIDVREHRNNNRGTWLANTAYLIGDVVINGGKTYTALNSATSITTPPTHTSSNAYDGPGATGVNWQYDAAPAYNRGINLDGDEGKLAIGIEAGKAYVRGYEIEKTGITYIPVTKARTYAQATASIIPAVVGNYFLVTNTNSLPPIDTLELVSLRNYITGVSVGTDVGTEVGTARVRFYEWHTGLPYSSSSIYKLGLFDIQMKSGYDFAKDVKSVTYTTSAVAATSFSADISPVNTQLIGSVTASSTTITGTGTSFQTDLKVNDLVLISGGGSTYYRRVTTVTNQNTIVVDSTITVTGATIARCTTQLLEPNNTSLIYPLPYYGIRSMRTAGTGGVNNTTFTCYQKFTATATGTSLTLSTSGSFASASGSTNFACVDNTTGATFTPTAISVSGSTASITVPAGQSGHSISVVATVIRNGGGYEKTKTLTNTSETFTTATTAQANIIYLDKADVFKIVSITMATGSAFGTTPSSGAYTVDISDRFDFDNGQKSSHYDWGSLTLKPSFAAPSNPIKVTYQYFEHGTGDYFDVNSYSGIDYKQIPSYLRDGIDYRPRVANKSAGSAKNFISTGGIVSAVPKRGESVQADYSYYLARKDKIVLGSNGELYDILGVSSTTPGYPADPALGMVLYTLDLEPYTFGTTNVNISATKIDNKRYTMRDIGKLETRINTLEYYTSLSLLEQETNSLRINDSNGNNRMKNGFVVDNFTGGKTGDITNQDYLCAIDMENKQLRPFYTSYNMNLLERYSNDAARSAANYKLSGDILTLPIIDTPILIQQQYASRLENINPFAIFTFLGNVNLTPSSDDWFETNRLPDIIQQVEGNYNSMLAIAQKSGILGTVWSAWKTEWIGQPVVTGNKSYSADRRAGDGGAWLDATFGNVSSGHGWAARTVTTAVTATASGQSRTGVNTSIAVKTNYEITDDRIVSTAVIPYIRSRNILVQSKKLKPLTKFYPYFDGVDVSAYCTPATKLVYTPISGTFDYKTNVGGQGSETKRRINGDSQVCLNSGDVITNSAGTASAVVVNAYIDENNAYCLSVVNVIGTFLNNQAFSASVSGAQGTVVTITTPSTFVTNSVGDLEMLFNIPQSESIRFRTGKREFKLHDASTYSGNYTSRGLVTYEASGTLSTRQVTVNAVRNAEIVQEQILPDPKNPDTMRTISIPGEYKVSDTGWYDPLAQSFLVEQRGGAFLTGIDIFFATKDSNIPVTLSIRDMVNGVPGKHILPFSTVTLKPSQVSLSSTTVTDNNGNIHPTFDTPTRFNFETPVYVQENQEYCFVLQSDSNNYNVWTSYLGDMIPGSGRTISEQPYAGVMFKSQNASTWTPDDSADIKFTIYRAKFNTAVVGNVEFVNDVIPLDTLDNNPFETTSGSNLVRIWHYDHGMSTGSTVYIDAAKSNDPATGTITATTSSDTVTGVGTLFSTELAVGANLYNSQDVYLGTITAIGSDTSLTLSANSTTAVTAGSFQYIAPVNGIPANQIYKSSVIGNVDMNCYTITTTDNATATGYTGGTLVRASRNIPYDTIIPSVQMMSFSDTTTTFGIKTTSGKSIDGSQTPYTLDTLFKPCLIKQDNTFYSPRVIASEWNENVLMAGNKSLGFSATLASSNDSLSPIIDTSRASLIAISNKLNYPTESNTNISVIDNVTAFTGATGAFTFVSGGTLTSTNSSVRTAMAGIGIGKYVTISSATTSGNNGTFLVTDFSDNGTTATLTLNTTFTGESAVSGTTVTSRILFADEIAPVGSSSVSKYVTNPIKFVNPSTYLRVMFAANCPSEADIFVYYKTCSGDDAQLNTAKYIKMIPDGNGLAKVDNGNRTFTDVTYTLTGLKSFDTTRIKIVMNSTNSAAVPIITDFRVISCP